MIVFEGVVELSNALGAVSVGAGEAGIARPGRPPVKEFVIRSPEAAHWALQIDIGWIDVLPEVLTGSAAEHSPSKNHNVVAPRCKPRKSEISAAQLAIRDGRFDEARERLAAVPAGTEAGQLAELTRIELLMGRKNLFDEAAVRLRSVEARAPSSNWRPGALRVWLDAYAGSSILPSPRCGVCDSAIRTWRGLPRSKRSCSPFRGEYAAALVAGREGVALNPDDYLALHWVGVPAMQAEPTPETARTAFEAALALKPDHVHINDETCNHRLSPGRLSRGEGAQASRRFAGAT